MTAEQNRPLKAIKTSQRVVLPDGSEGVVTGVALGSDGEPLVRVRAVKATDALLNWFRDVSANGRARGIQFSSSEPDNMIRAAEREGWIERRPNYPSGVTNPQYDITAKGRNALKQQPARSASKSGDVTVLAARSVKARPYDDAWGRQITEVIDRKLGYDFVWDNSDGTFTVGYRYMNPGDGGLQEAQRQQDAMVRKVQQVFPGARVRYEKVLMPRLGDARYYTIQVRFAPRRQAGKAAKADNGEGALENLERKIQSSRDSTPEQAKKVIAQLFAEYRRIVAAHEDITDNTAHKQLYNLLANPPSMLGVSASRYWNTVEQAIGNLISQLAQSRSRDYGKAAKADDSQLVADAKRMLAGGKSVKASDPKSLYLDLRQIVIKAEGAIKPAVAKQLAGQLEALRPRIASFNQEYGTSINADAAQKLLQPLINPRKYQQENRLSADQLLRNVVNIAVKLKHAVGQMAYEVNDARLKGGKSASAKTPSTRVGSVVVKNELGFMPHPDTSGDWFFNIDGVENRIYGRYAEALRKAVMIAKRDLLTEITVTGVRRDYGQ